MRINATTDQEQKILVEQIQNLYRALIPILAVHLVVGSAMLYGLSGKVSPLVLKTWMGLLLLVICVRMASYWFYRRNFTSENVLRYAHNFVIGTGVTALLWGAGSVAMFPQENLEYQLFILVILIGMAAGSISSLINYLPAFYAYLPLSMFPISFELISTGKPTQLSLGLMVIAYTVALAYFGRNNNRILLDSLTLRFENMDLVKQLRLQKNQAEQANVSKSKFLAAASHDLRQPLHALTLFTSVLDESNKDPKVATVVDQIKASVHALQSLFNALLDISRLEAGVMRVEKSEFYLRPLFEKLANDYHPQAREKGLQLYWSDCRYAVYSDESLLEQILRNYIANAIRYTNSGEVRVGCDAIDNQIIIEVTDTGVGISDEDKHYIYEEFRQLSNSDSDRNKGMGLGLAIVQRTARLLGHRIGVESVVGKGSTFSITLQQMALAACDSESRPDYNSDSEQACDAFILVIDDEASVRESSKSLLELWGCTVITAQSKQDSIAKIKMCQRTPDGIIADYRLLNSETGVEAIHAIRTIFNKDIPALIVTGNLAMRRSKEINKSGFQVLQKPVAPVKLRSFLRNIQMRKET